MLLNHHVSLPKILKYFDACVTPTILFAICTLPLTRTKMGILDVLQRRMLRRIVGWRRLDGEPWRDTMARMSQRLERADQLYHCEPWSRMYAKNQWRYAEHIINGSDALWSSRLADYNSKPNWDAHAPFAPRRSRGRPCMKWDDRLHSFCEERWPNRCGEHWTNTLGDANMRLLEDAYMNFVT